MNVITGLTRRGVLTRICVGLPALRAGPRHSWAALTVGGPTKGAQPANVVAASTIMAGDLAVNRLGFGAIRMTVKGIWGPPSDPLAGISHRRGMHRAGD